MNGEAVTKNAMVDTISIASRRLGVVDSPDGTLRVTGRSLRSTGAQGLIHLGWRPDAVQLMGRWMSEAVKRYTRDAALFAPLALTPVMVNLCGIPPSDVPPAPSSGPEPTPPPRGEWIMNTRTGMYHLPSSRDGHARCGWIFESSGILGQEAPPWHFVTCKQCAPAHRRRLKEAACADAVAVMRSHPDPDDLL